jgi:hypothetical protein
VLSLLLLGPVKSNRIEMVQLFPEVHHAENIERKALKHVDCRGNTSSSLLHIFLGLDCAVKQIADLACLLLEYEDQLPAVRHIACACQHLACGSVVIAFHVDYTLPNDVAHDAMPPIQFPKFVAFRL